MLNYGIYLFQTKSLQRPSLILGNINFTPNLLYLYLCHNLTIIH